MQIYRRIDMIDTRRSRKDSWDHEASQVSKDIRNLTTLCLHVHHEETRQSVSSTVQTGLTTLKVQSMMSRHMILLRDSTKNRYEKDNVHWFRISPAHQDLICSKNQSLWLWYRDYRSRYLTHVKTEWVIDDGPVEFRLPRYVAIICFCRGNDGWVSVRPKILQKLRITDFL